MANYKMRNDRLLIGDDAGTFRDVSVPRGQFIGKASVPVKDESEHFIKCAACGGWMDCRDLGVVFAHEGPLPHPACDQVQ